MDINISMVLDELLELWVKYAYNTFQGDSNTIPNIEDRKRINAALVTKGVEHIEISNMTTDAYTVRYRIRHTWNTKEIAITN